jgi:hypothetical protein
MEKHRYYKHHSSTQPTPLSQCLTFNGITGPIDIPGGIPRGRHQYADLSKPLPGQHTAGKTSPRKESMLVNLQKFQQQVAAQRLKKDFAPAHPTLPPFWVEELDFLNPFVPTPIPIQFGVSPDSSEAQLSKCFESSLALGEFLSQEAAYPRATETFGVEGVNISTPIVGRWDLGNLGIPNALMTVAMTVQTVPSNAVFDSWILAARLSFGGFQMCDDLKLQYEARASVLFTELAQFLFSSKNISTKLVLETEHRPFPSTDVDWAMITLF